MTGLFHGMFGRSRRQVIRDNAAQGKEGEERVRSNYEMAGYEVKRTGKGHDYKVTRKSWLGGRDEVKYVEVKTGNSKLSPLQKRKKRRLGDRYVVERTATWTSSPGTESLWGGATGVFGTPSGSKRRRKSGSRSGGSRRRRPKRDAWW